MALLAVLPPLADGAPVRRLPALALPLGALGRWLVLLQARLLTCLGWPRTRRGR
jgi:hypothetical protein